jgi:septum formation topological specificity factor MinE
MLGGDIIVDELKLDWIWEQAMKRKYLAVKVGKYRLKISRKKDGTVKIIMIDIELRKAKKEQEEERT